MILKTIVLINAKGDSNQSKIESQTFILNKNIINDEIIHTVKEEKTKTLSEYDIAILIVDSEGTCKIKQQSFDNAIKTIKNGTNIREFLAIVATKETSTKDKSELTFEEIVKAVLEKIGIVSSPIYTTKEACNCIPKPSVVLIECPPCHLPKGCYLDKIYEIYFFQAEFIKY